MKLSKILLASGLVLFGLTGCGGDKSAIITINGEPITKAQYQKVYNEEISGPQYQQFESFLKDENSMMSLMLRDRIVNELILKEILRQETVKRNIEVTKEEIAARREKIIEDLGSVEKLEEVLKNSGVSNKQFEQDIENEIKVDKLINSVKSTKVSDKEVKDFYNQNKQMFNFPDRVRASHILIEVNPAAITQEIVSEDKNGKLTSEEINKKSQEIIDQKMALAKEIRAKAAKNPENFAALAKQYSDDKVSAMKGGDLGFFTRESMVKPFSDAAFKLKPGTVSEVVVSDFGNHIIIVTDKASAGIQPYEKMKDEISVYLEQKKKVEILTKLLDDLKMAAKIEFNDENFDLNNIQKMIKEKSKAEEKIQQELKKSK